MFLAKKALKQFLKEQKVLPANIEQIKIWLIDFANYIDEGLFLVDHKKFDKNKK